jgi:hypothetical protein
MISLMHGPPLGTGARAASAHVGAFTTLFTKYLVVCPSKLELPASHLPSYVSIDIRPTGTIPRFKNMRIEI